MASAVFFPSGKPHDLATAGYVTFDESTRLLSWPCSPLEHRLLFVEAENGLSVAMYRKDREC